MRTDRKSKFLDDKKIYFTRRAIKNLTSSTFALINKNNKILKAQQHKNEE